MRNNNNENIILTDFITGHLPGQTQHEALYCMMSPLHHHSGEEQLEAQSSRKART